MVLQRLFSMVKKWLFDFETAGYHPERHYMRGAGPACLRRDMTRPN